MIVAALVMAGLTCVIAALFYLRLGVPLHLTYGLWMPIVIGLCAAFGPRDRNALVLAIAMAILWLAGFAVLRTASDQSHFHASDRARGDVVGALANPPRETS